MEIIKGNKTLFIVILILIILFIGLIKKNDKKRTEFCYKGVTYVHFGTGSRSWGSVMFDKNGSIVKCKKEE